MISETGGVACAVCGSAQIRPIAEQPLDYEYNVIPAEPLLVYSCFSCSSGFIHPRPAVSDLVSFYPADYHAYNEDHGSIASTLVSMREKKRAQHYAKLTSNRPIRLFDVGTGDCRHFKTISAFGDFEFSGIEINPAMAEKAKENGFNIHCGTLETLDIRPMAASFDIITMYQLAEHVLDPFALVSKAAGLLKPGGYLVGQLPCNDSWERMIFGRYWAGYHYPRHLQMFSKKGLSSLLERAGFGDVGVASALHLQAALSAQNYLVGNGYKPVMKFGKTPVYSLLLMLAAPYCIIEHAFGRGGMMNFIARKKMGNGGYGNK